MKVNVLLTFDDFSKSDITFESSRSVASRARPDADAARRLFETEIRDRTKERAAFPVLPLPSAAGERVG